MRAASVVWLLVAASLVSLVPAAPERVAVGLAHSGALAEGRTLGSNPFAAPPTTDGCGGAVHFAARLSGGALPQAIFRVPAADGPPIVSLAAGMPSPYGPAYLEFLSPVACDPWSAFWTRLDDEAGTDEAIVVSGAASASGVVRTGEVAPGGGTFDALGAAPGVGPDGSVVFLALVEGAPSPALFARDSTGTMTRLLAVESEPPWAPGTTIVELGAPARSCAGTVALVVTVLAEGTEQDHFVLGAPGDLAPVFDSGTLLAPGMTVERLLGPAAPGPDGDWYLRALLAPDGSEAIVRVPIAGPPELLARSGDAAPVGGAIAGIGPPCAWRPGRAAFRATLATDAGLPAGATQVALLGTGPALETIVTPGDSMSTGLPIDDFGDPSCAGDGSIVFTARTASGERVARWEGGNVSTLAASGETTPASGLYLDGGFKTSNPVLLDDGSVAFEARLASSDGTGGLVRATPGGVPILWLAPGDEVDGQRMVLAVSGTPAPLGPGVVVAALLATPAHRPAYVHVGSGPGVPALVAVGDPTPIGGTFLSLGPNPASTGSDALIFGAAVSGGGAPVGLFIRDGAGELRALAVTGTLTDEGEVLSSFSFAPVPSGDGAVAFRAVTVPGAAGIWTIDTAAGSPPPSLVVRTGQIAPGGGTIATVGEPTAGPEGSVAMIATLADGRSMVLVAKNGSLRAGLATGDPVGGVEVATLNSIDIDASGAALASVGLTGAPHRAVVRESGAGLELLIAGEDPGPETLPGSRLASFGALGTHADGRLAVATDIDGWSPGSAIVLAAADADADGRGDPVDCAPADGSVHAVPGEVGTLRLAPASSPPSGMNPALRLTWSEPARPGGDSVSFDLIAGGLASLRTSGFADASCVASQLTAPDLTLEPSATGADRWFLVRARNACGPGGIGAAPSRAPLEALACPSQG